MELRGIRSAHCTIGCFKFITGKTPELARRHSVAEAMIENWKAKYGGLEVPEAKRLRSLEKESGRLKWLLAEVMLDNAGLKDLLAING